MVKTREVRLPPEIVQAVSAESPPSEAVLLATVDERSYPHFALLSYGEMILAEGRLHLFVHGGSRTAAFLTRGGRCTLAFAGERGVFYVKGEAFECLRAESVAVFRIESLEVERDLPAPGEGGAAVISGIRFTMSEDSRARRAELRSRIRRLLQSSTI